ncbi:hypothetical protein BaRGS_00038856 [Batillaria attramentaria]|uniref:Uncharacterized protein n=1 Tax=Batillaria attramentaria TaxID=370345 RepID=A0ABD0J5M4_9CAEN
MKRKGANSADLNQEGSKGSGSSKRTTTSTKTLSSYITLNACGSGTTNNYATQSGLVATTAPREGEAHFSSSSLQSHLVGRWYGNLGQLGLRRLLTD